MRTMTISEGLAEIKTISKRVDKKREFVRGFLFRQDALKDPHEKQGGSIKLVQQERQAISDLLNEVVKIRAAIVSANASNKVTIGGIERSISDWIVWRRDVSAIAGACLVELHKSLKDMRAQAQQKGMSVGTTSSSETKAADVIVNIDESKLLKEIEEHEQILGGLDAALSVKNATTVISI